MRQKIVELHHFLHSHKKAQFYESLTNVKLKLKAKKISWRAGAQAKLSALA